MSDAKTTADLFRERGWGVGTKVRNIGTGFVGEVLAVHGGDVAIAVEPDHISLFGTWLDWSLYTPTPPVPTAEEWRELWGKLKAWRSSRKEDIPRQYGDTIALVENIDAIAAKGDAA